MAAYAGTISKETRNHMLVVALLLDLLSLGLTFIPAIGQVLSPIINMLAMIGFWMWFAIRGLGWPGAGRAGISTLIEFIPVLQAVPQNTLMVLSMYATYKVGDITKLA